jgi:hypothetical protein
MAYAANISISSQSIELTAKFVVACRPPLDQKLGAVLLAGIMRLISLTLAALTFSSRAVSRTPRPSSRAARIRPIWNGVVLGLPRRLPDDRARSKPAIT